MRPLDSKDEEMEHDSTGQHPFLSYAKQVSFPKWNVMVGELGEKFTRRSSLEKEYTVETQENDIADQVASGHEQNRHASEPELKLRSKLPAYMKQSSFTENNVNDLCEGENKALKDTNTGRKQIFRYCEIIKEESKESDEEINDENENNIQSYVSTVNITLQRNKSQSQIEVLTPPISCSNENQHQQNGNYAYSRQTNERAHVKEDITMNNADDKRLRRTVAIDVDHLAPQSTEMIAPDKTHKKTKGRIRKKSSSFSGALPLRFPSSNDENKVDEPAPHSPVLGSRHAPVRRRGTIDMGRIDIPKSPKVNGGRPKRADPSHYLMQNMGKRRGSYNPTYDQSNLKTTKSKKNYTRAKSMHVPHAEERHKLRERLLQHACPELRESLELDISENEDNEDDKTLKDNELKKDISSSELTRRKISLAKSASFNSFAALVDNTKETKNKVRIENDAMSTSNLHAIKSSRKTGRTDSNIITSISEHQNLSKVVSDSEQKHTQKHHSRHGRLNTTRARNTRSQSSFDGISPMYLGRLRQASFEHRKLDRSKSDSMSSVSSSEGSDISLTDPFPMHYAAKHGKTKPLQKMISCGKNVNTLDAEGWPPIHYALTAGHFECVACLLNAGANITNYSKERTSKYFR